jgi:hypothetical protein
MAFRLSGLSTCAGKELHGWNSSVSQTTPKRVMKHMINVLSSHQKHNLMKNTKRPKSYGYAFYVCSFAYGQGRPKENAKRINKFADFVHKNKLGTCVIAPDTPNPVHNDNSILRSMIWAPDNEAMWKYFKKNKKTLLTEQQLRGWKEPQSIYDW